jgi:glycosyltransferase involved in cell wall biosynthesis
VVVCDNDALASAREVTERVQRETGLQITYVIQPRKNIAAARNTSVQNATGDFIAFIDDDEFPNEDWLLTLYTTITQRGAAGVLAPVLPHFDVEPPAWVRKGRFYERPRHATGFRMGWAECRTGNVLLRRDLCPSGELAFSEEFANGGEDQDFFRRMEARGHEFIWCDEAAVRETVPPERWNIRIMFSRALLRGKNSLRHKEGRLKNLLKSAVAFPLYSMALPVLWLRGEHYYVKYLIKTGDHAGRILALFGVNPIQERQG